MLKPAKLIKLPAGAHWPMVPVFSSILAFIRAFRPDLPFNDKRGIEGPLALQ